MKELIENIKEFLESGEDNLAKERFNAATSDFFKAIAISCDYLLEKEIKIIPKNHAERFSLLNKHFKEIYNKVSELFSAYVRAYNSKINKEDALKLRKYAYRIRDIINKK